MLYSRTYYFNVCTKWGLLEFWKNCVSFCENLWMGKMLDFSTDMNLHKKKQLFLFIISISPAKRNVRMIQWRRFVFFFFYQFQLYFFDKNCPKIMEMVVLIRIITIECTYIMECMYHILWSINHAISFILMPFNFAIFFTNYLNLICRLQNSCDWEYGCNSGNYVYYIDTK